MFASNKKALPSDQSGWLSIDSNVQLLPGLTESVVNAEMAAQLLRQLQTLGLEKAVLTAPISEQSSYSLLTIQRSYEEVCKKLVSDKAEIEVMLGGVYRIDKGFMALLKKNDLIPVAGSHILLDLPMEAEPPFIENIIFELEVAGFNPILAHPERYAYYHQNEKRYRKLKSLGCLFQLSLLSLAGYHGDKTKRMAQKLLKEGMVDLNGSGVSSESQVKILTEFIKGQSISSALYKDGFKNRELFG